MSANGLPAKALPALVQGMFKEIAVVFQPQNYSTTERILLVKAIEVAERLRSTKLHRLEMQSVPVTDFKHSQGCPGYQDDEGDNQISVLDENVAIELGSGEHDESGYPVTVADGEETDGVFYRYIAF